MKHEQIADPESATERGKGNGGERAAGVGDCPTCGKADLVASPISTVFRTTESLAVIRGIPAMVCPACREEYLDDQTATRLDIMRGRGFGRESPVATMSVPVYAFDPGDRGKP